MAEVKRVILMVMDSLGVGALPDAEKYGDKGADTLGHIADRMGDGFKIPELSKLGFGNIEAAAGGRFRTEKPEGSFGTEIIETLGDEHEATGKPIIYTSADSVLQIAANTDVIPLAELYEICEKARALLQGDWACGRVIARPYVKENGRRVRTSDRHDYAVAPPEDTLLDKVEKAGKTVYAVGKIRDIFDGKGVTESVHTVSNMDGVDKTVEAMEKDFAGFIFTNLVDFDSMYGHRRNPEGYGQAIMDFDGRLPEIKAAMKPGDVLMLCADHGNDPVHSGTDHTREHIPLVVFGEEIKAGVNLGTRKSFADIGATIAEMLGAETTSIGESFAKEILK